MYVLDDGFGRFKKLAGQRVVLCPNHCSEDDATFVFGLSRALEEDFSYLTAHEIFHGHHGINQYVLPWLGCYSITRGLGDMSAFKTTRRLILENERKLVVFPEGEISHFNELVMPIEPGVVGMSFSALEKLKLDPQPSEIYILPVAIKYQYPKNIQNRLNRALRDIEKILGLSTINTDSMKKRTENAVISLMKKIESNHGTNDEVEFRFAERAYKLRSKILAKVSAQLGIIVPDEYDQLEFAHMLKSRLCNLHFHRTDNLPDLHGQSLKHLYEDVMLAIDLIAIEKSCVTSSFQTASQDELAEVLHLLERVLFKNNRVYGFRHIKVKIGDPIALGHYFNEYKADRDKTTLKINKRIRLDLLSMLSSLNTSSSKAINISASETRG
ncbi:MAG: 1-acyl-sn-glycerol-3-phosphate acyltransferase [Cyanobacteria bacterium]|nr:1-acyl-sn-glycerol-3-phosphate acyltransferase [Cyanobacteriota bacterium]